MYLFNHVIYLIVILVYCIIIIFMLPAIYSNVDIPLGNYHPIIHYHYETFIGSAIVLVVFIITEYITPGQYDTLFRGFIISYSVLCALTLFYSIAKIAEYGHRYKNMVNTYGNIVWVYPVTRFFLLIFLILEIVFLYVII